MNSRVPQSSSVRRKLDFGEDSPPNEALRDNMDNQINELIVRDRLRMRNVYNFDSQNDVPLEGRYKWRRGNGNYDWIARLDDEIHVATDDAKNAEGSMEDAPSESDKGKSN